MKIFLDTEFSNLIIPESRLISIALVSEDGRSFYAELPPDGYIKTCSDFVKSTVLPLLRGGDAEAEPTALVISLREWLSQFDFVEIVTDAPSWDFPFLRAAIDEGNRGWPRNVATGAVLFSPSETSLQTFFSAPERHQHHALDDALALREAWLSKVSDRSGSSLQGAA